MKITIRKLDDVDYLDELASEEFSSFFISYILQKEASS